MPVVDFTLDDVRKVVKLEVMDAEGRIKREIIEYIGVTHAELKAELKADMKQQFDGVNQRLDRLEGDMKGVKRVVNQHSVEIMELKAKLRPA